MKIEGNFTAENKYFLFKQTRSGNEDTKGIFMHCFNVVYKDVILYSVLRVSFKRYEADYFLHKTATNVQLKLQA